MKKVTLDELAVNMNKRFDGIDKKFDTVKIEILKDIEELLAPTENKVKKVENELKHFQKSVEDKLTYIRRQNELVVTGVPFKQKENLYRIFELIASIMGYSNKPASLDFLIPDIEIFRMPGNDPKKRRIIIKFASEITKERFLHRSFKFSKKLTLASIGMKANDQFYIQQNLAPFAQKLKLAALKAKKEELIKKVKTVNGEIFIQIEEKGNFSLVKSLEDIPVTVLEVNDSHNDGDDDDDENSANSHEESN